MSNNESAASVYVSEFGVEAARAALNSPEEPSVCNWLGEAFEIDGGVDYESYRSDFFAGLRVELETDAAHTAAMEANKPISWADFREETGLTLGGLEMLEQHVIDGLLDSNKTLAEKVIKNLDMTNDEMCCYQQILRDNLRQTEFEDSL